jgi:hypothetical protein
MSRRRSKKSRKEIMEKADRNGGHSETASLPAKPTNRQKTLLALIVLLEIGWIAFLLVLAVTK